MLDALLMKISLVLRGALSENKLKNTERDFSLLSRFGRTLSFICVHQGSTGRSKKPLLLQTSWWNTSCRMRNSTLKRLNEGRDKNFKVKRIAKPATVCWWCLESIPLILSWENFWLCTKLTRENTHNAKLCLQKNISILYVFRNTTYPKQIQLVILAYSCR